MEQPKPQPSQTLTTTQLAERWAMDPRTLRRWRAQGLGPEWIKLTPASNALVRYRLEDIEAYELQQRGAR